jgi:hypothetical protein
MEPFALALAGSGYVAVTYDFLGHGRHPLPMRGDLMEQDGTPAFLIGQTREVAVGALEGRLETGGRRMVAMRAGGEPESVTPFTTYGHVSDGTARRLVVSPRVEHVGVLYSATTLDETRRWLDGVFGWGGEDPLPGRAHGRGVWIALLMTAVFLPVVVGDYLAVHFFTVGVLTSGLLWWTGGRPRVGEILERGGVQGHGALRVVLGAGGMVAFFLMLMVWPLDRFFTSFFPVVERLPLMLAVLVGTLPHFLADEWLTRGAHSRRGAYAFTKVLFILSLGVAVGLDFQALFFLVIIFPVILVFFVVHGLFSCWAFQSTGSPLVAGLGNAVAFAWAMAVTFPMYAGPT